MIPGGKAYEKKIYIALFDTDSVFVSECSLYICAYFSGSYIR